jgi:hypothetical protein
LATSKPSVMAERIGRDLSALHVDGVHGVHAREALDAAHREVRTAHAPVKLYTDPTYSARVASKASS